MSYLYTVLVSCFDVLLSGMCSYPSHMHVTFQIILLSAIIAKHLLHSFYPLLVVLPLLYNNCFIPSSIYQVLFMVKVILAYSGIAYSFNSSLYTSCRI